MMMRRRFIPVLQLPVLMAGGWLAPVQSQPAPAETPTAAAPAEAAELPASAPEPPAEPPPKPPPPPPQDPMVYLRKYGPAGVPATIVQGNERTKVVILGKPNHKGIIEGVDHQGNIRYRPVRVLNLASKPSYGWRFTGPGYNDVSNPTLQLQVGHSYVFKVDDLQRYPFLVYKPNPAKPFEKEPYKGFEILNNGSDLEYVRFTPAPDTPDELAYCNLEYSRMKGKIKIIKTPAPDNGGEEIYLSVNYRRALIEQYISLLSQGFITQPVPLGTENLDLYKVVEEGFNAGETWFQSLVTKKAQTRHSLFLLNQDPAAILNAHQYTAAFPKPDLVETIQVHRMDIKQQAQPGKKYLISCNRNIEDKEFSILFEALLKQEAPFRADIQNILKELIIMKGRNPTDPFIKHKLIEGVQRLEVSSNHSLRDFKNVRNSFESMLQGFRQFKVAYAIDSPSFQKAQTTVAKGDLLHGLEALRPIVYPVIKIASIPKTFGNHRISPFQDHIEYYLEVLVRAASTDSIPTNYQHALAQEAFVILWVLPLIELNNKTFIRRALDVVGLLARTGNPNDIHRARLMLTIVPFDKNDDDMVNAFFKVAGDFRSAGNYQDALNIYEQFLHLPDSPYYREACLWSAFCKASPDPPGFGAAQLFLNQFLATYKAEGGTPPRDDSIYSLWRLIEALLAYKDPEQPLEDAMDKVSEAVVFCRIGYTWVPEILALSAQCYEEKGMADTAKNVYRELKVFFPKHPKTRQFEIEFPHLVKD